MEFASPEILDWLERSDEESTDVLAFGVVRMDQQGNATRYNLHESLQSGLSKNEVLNQRFFEHVAPCMNNLMVAGRFAECRRSGTSLDATIDYVLAFRSAAAPVKLRLLYSPGAASHYLLIKRL